MLTRFSPGSFDSKIPSEQHAFEFHCVDCLAREGMIYFKFLVLF